MKLIPKIEPVGIVSIGLYDEQPSNFKNVIRLEQDKANLGIFQDFRLYPKLDLGNLSLFQQQKE